MEYKAAWLCAVPVPAAPVAVLAATGMMDATGAIGSASLELQPSGSVTTSFTRRQLERKVAGRYNRKLGK